MSEGRIIKNEKRNGSRSILWAIHMNRVIQWVILLLIFLLARAGGVQAQTNILPGVTYYAGREALTGKLTFLLSRDVTLESTSTNAASVYEFDLAKRTLRKVADTPQGLFIPSNEGGSFCVIFDMNHGLLNKSAKAFIHLDSVPGNRILNLERDPEQTVVVGGHVFFTLEMVDTQKNTLVTKLIDYDIARDEKRQIEFPDASRWQHQYYNRIHVPKGATNILHFYYKGFGNRLREGKDYRDGYYSLDVATGDSRWFAELLDDKDDESYNFRTADGRYVFFEGPDSPIRGFKLVSSPWNFLETESQDPKGKKVKLLKAFSKLSVRLGNAYMLSQVSPDGHYVLVSLPEPCVPESWVQPGWIYTYFLLDASNGKTRVLLKDRVEQKTKGSMSAVSWIR